MSDVDARDEYGFTRRLLLRTAAVAGAGTALAWGAPAGTALAASPGPTAARTGDAGWLAHPGRPVQPKFRWWWPDGLVDPREIRREVNQIADAGFGGVEIAAVTHSLDDKTLLHVAENGWGTPAWTAGVEAALDQAAKRGITVDLTVGPSWPTAVPSITADSEAAVKELAHGAVQVAGGTTYTGPVPAPVVAAASGVTRQQLVLVQAAQIDTANSTRKETGLSFSSVRDLTDQVAEGTISWTAPSDGEWVLIAYWMRGSGQTPESGPHTSPAAYVVDHFSEAGIQAVIDFWEAHILTAPVRRLLKKAGGALFEDSLEIETDALQWTSGLPAAFEKYCGYALEPYLPAVILSKSNQVFAFDAALTRQVRHDFWNTVSRLFNDHHVTVLKKWAHSLGLKLRMQPYGLQTDAIATASILDIPEGESLGFKNLDDYRCLAGARDMAGRTILSCESGAYTGGAYNTTWQKFLTTMGGAYAAGVNQTVVHGFSYATVPGVKWPGYAAFTPYHGKVGYGESWGPRQPTWQHIPDVSGYLSRIHQVLQSGTARADVAVFRQTGYTATGIGASWFTASGIPLGWTHQFISGPLLELPHAKVSGGRLAPDGPAYKALFIEGDFFSGSTCTLRVADAERLLDFTMAGLPIVMLGAWDTATVPGVPADGENERLRTVVSDLLAQPRVRRVSDKADVGAALADLGVQPAVRYATASTLLNAHRVADGVDYYYLCNGKHAENVKPPVAPIDHEVTLRRTGPEGVPYLLDLWTGRARRIGRYVEDDGSIRLRVTLQPAETALVAIGRPGLFGDRAGKRPHAVSSQAESVEFVDGELTVRHSAACTVDTVLSQGRTVRTTIGEVPDPRVLSAWQLHVEDWRPGGAPTTTTVTGHDLKLDALAPWSQLDGLEDVSGVGRYRTTVTLERSWTGGYGAYLELGPLNGTCRVTVNGNRLDAVDQINPVVDVGPWLKRGDNTIEVEVATTLANRLRVSDPDVYGGLARQQYGLTGPVRLVPYGQARVG
ncbi:glycosyl hydrolase [Streptomyces sp. NPDC051322]|uniref:glycosyl hydrolase n=1 Tax=Streptomyces sp. NPDC051322 TaxID=3154645 RepID=UPI00344E8EE4